MCGNLLPELDRLDDTKSDILALAKKLAVVVAVMLWGRRQWGPEACDRGRLTLTKRAGPRNK